MCIYILRNTVIWVIARLQVLIISNDALLFAGEIANLHFIKTHECMPHAHTYFVTWKLPTVQCRALLNHK